MRVLRHCGALRLAALVAALLLVGPVLVPALVLVHALVAQLVCSLLQSQALPWGLAGVGLLLLGFVLGLLLVLVLALVLQLAVVAAVLHELVPVGDEPARVVALSLELLLQACHAQQQGFVCP